MKLLLGDHRFQTGLLELLSVYGIPDIIVQVTDNMHSKMK